MAHLPGYYVAVSDDPHKYELSEQDVRATAKRGVQVVVAPVAIDAFNPQSPFFNAEIKARTDAMLTRNLTLLKKRGVKIVFGSDRFGNTPLNDVLYLQKLGVFSNLQMLKIWTEDSPRAIFPSRKLGFLKEGYEASFLVLDGNPLTDFGQVKSIRTRFKQGYAIDFPQNDRPK